MTERHLAECVAALRRLVDECESVMDTLASLPEEQLAAWVHNLWYEALTDARAVLNDGSDASGG